MKKYLLAVLILLSHTAFAADYYLDFTLSGVSSSTSAFLPIKLTKLSLDVTNTGRSFSANGSFYSEGLKLFIPTIGTCLLLANGDISCTLMIKVSPYSMDFDVTLFHSTTGFTNGLIQATITGGTVTNPFETGLLKVTAIKTKL